MLRAASRDRWRCKKVDRARTADQQGASSAGSQDYGEDSDFVRSECAASSRASAPSSSPDRGRARRPTARADHLQPLVMGVDVARFGDDRPSSVSGAAGTPARGPTRAPRPRHDDVASGTSHGAGEASRDGQSSSTTAASAPASSIGCGSWVPALKRKLALLRCRMASLKTVGFTGVGRCWKQRSALFVVGPTNSIAIVGVVACGQLPILGCAAARYSDCSARNSIDNSDDSFGHAKRTMKRNI